MNKAKELLNELQNLDMDIQAGLNEINELIGSVSALQSPKWTDVKVKVAQKLNGLMMSILNWLS